MKKNLIVILLICFIGCAKESNIRQQDDKKADLMSTKTIPAATSCNPISAIHVSGSSTSATVSWLGSGTSVTLVLRKPTGWSQSVTSTGSSYTFSVSPGATYSIDFSTTCQSVTTLTYSAPSSPIPSPPSCQPLEITRYDASDHLIILYTNYVGPTSSTQNIRIKYRESVSGSTGLWQEKNFTLTKTQGYSFFITVSQVGACCEVQIASYCDNGTSLSGFSSSYYAYTP